MCSYISKRKDKCKEYRAEEDFKRNWKPIINRKQRINFYSCLKDWGKGVFPTGSKKQKFQIFRVGFFPFGILVQHNLPYSVLLHLVL